MNNKIILITGANKGIGFETARQLALSGHTVIVTARDAARGNEAMKKLNAMGVIVHFVALDVKDGGHIKDAVVSMEKQFGRLDVLINNAAVMYRSDTSLLFSEDAVLKDTFETNAIAPLKLTQAFIPIMPGGSRVIMVSSGGGSMTDNVDGWCPLYCISKSMLNAETRHLAYYLAEKKISVNAVCPGWVQTDMGGKEAPRRVEQGADTIAWLATEAPQDLTGKFFRDRNEIPW